MQGSVPPVKERPVVERLKHEAFVGAVGHSASLPARGSTPRSFKTTRAYEGNQQSSLLVRPAPVASRKLEGEKVGLPSLRLPRDRWAAIALGFTSKVPDRFEQCAEPCSHGLQRETDVWGGKKRLASAAFLKCLTPLPTAFSTCYYSNLWRPV